MHIPLLAIDPGTNPVIAARLADGTVEFWTEARGLLNLAPRLRELFPEGPYRVMFEQPSYYMEGDDVSSATTFAEAAGIAKGILVALGWGGRTLLVSPLAWMQATDPSQSWPRGKANYTKRKKFFDETAERLFAGSLQRKPKRSEGDALCILRHLENKVQNQ